jgi:hypothetical protein
MGLEFTKQIDAETRILSLRTKNNGVLFAYLHVYLYLCSRILTIATNYILFIYIIN